MTTMEGPPRPWSWRSVLLTTLKRSRLMAVLVAAFLAVFFVAVTLLFRGTPVKYLLLGYLTPLPLTATYLVFGRYVRIWWVAWRSKVNYRLLWELVVVRGRGPVSRWKFTGQAELDQLVAEERSRPKTIRLKPLEG